jgi:hypothetical protein
VPGATDFLFEFFRDATGADFFETRAIGLTLCFFGNKYLENDRSFCHAVTCYLVSADCTDGRIHCLQRHLCFVRVRPPRDLNRCLPWRSWPFKTIVGVRKQQVTTVAGTSASSGTNIWAVLLNDLHGTIMDEAKMQANRVRDLAALVVRDHTPWPDKSAGHVHAGSSSITLMRSPVQLIWINENGGAQGLA